MLKFSSIFALNKAYVAVSVYLFGTMLGRMYVRSSKKTLLSFWEEYYFISGWEHIILLNFQWMLFIIAYNWIITHVFGKINLEDYLFTNQRFIPDIARFALSTFFNLFNIETFPIVLLPYALAYRNIVYLIESRVNSLYQVPQSVSQIEMMKLIVFAFALIIFTQILTFELHELADYDNDLFLLLFAKFSGHSYFDILRAITEFFIYSIDQKNNGNSLTSCKANFIVKIIISLAELAFDIVTFGIFNSFSVLSHYYQLPFLVYSGMRLFTCIIDFSEWSSTLASMSKRLPDMKTEDLKYGDICIICRQKMVVGDCKRLPCNHCFHMTCIYLWIMHQPKCPLCQKCFKKIPDLDANGEYIKENRRHHRHHHHHHHHRHWLI